MKAKHIILTILGLGIAGLGYAAFRFYKRQQALLQQYEIKPIGAKILLLTASLVKIEFTLRFTNKSKIEATISSLYADLYVNTIYAGNITNADAVVIPAEGFNDFKMAASLAPAELLKNITNTATTLFQSKDIPYRLKGYAKIKSSFVALSVPFDYNGSIKKDILGI